MRDLSRLALSTLIALATCPLALSQSPPLRDPQAAALLERSLAALGGGQIGDYSDLRAQGTISLNFAQPTKASVVLEFLGRTQTRAEIASSQGTTVRVVNNRRGFIQNPDGSVRELNPLNLIAERVRLVPALSLLADYRNPSAHIELVGASKIDSAEVDVIAIALGETSEPSEFKTLQEITRTLFHINRVNGLVEKIEYTYFSEGKNSTKMKVEEFLGDYRLVQGFLIPFRRTTYLDARLESELVIASVAFNVGLSASEFVLPAVQQ